VPDVCVDEHVLLLFLLFLFLFLLLVLVLLITKAICQSKLDIRYHTVSTDCRLTFCLSFVDRFLLAWILPLSI
jgi:hypothetical protein